MSVGAALVAYNCISQDYCLSSSLESVTSWADEVVVVDAMSNDGTWEWLNTEYSSSSKVKLLRSDAPYIAPPFGWRTGDNWLTKCYNKARQALTSDWCLLVSADEVMHEDSIAQLFEVVKLGENVKPMFYVFWRDSHTLKSIEPVARLARTDTPITFNRDSFDETGTWVVQPEIKLFHYGFIRDFEKWRDKAKFLQTSLHGSYDAVWLESKTAIYGMVNKLLTFHGTHPKHAHDWLRAHGYQI